MHSAENYTTVSDLANGFCAALAGAVKIVRPALEKANAVLVKMANAVRPFVEKGKELVESDPAARLLLENLKNFDLNRLTVPYLPTDDRIIRLEHEVGELIGARQEASRRRPIGFIAPA